MAYNNKRVYQLGEPCDNCLVPTTQGKFGPYCYPCWKKNKDAPGSYQKTQNGNYAQSYGQNVTQSNLEAKNDPLQEDLQRRVAELELSRVRAVDAYKKLEDKLNSLAALVSTVTGENAVNLHTSIPPKAPIDTRSAKDMPLDPEYAAEILGGTVEKKWEFPRKP